ncbi:MAG TPA: bacillithiol biosynthesis cysteine-adding enzyme BshC [Gemmatimonadales bacterium]|jgi:bacillithiol biosynthesis cysteine-adding enzyme BshC|nr:bacillithiol biosynthesis cysteine-adding enzyme BshC [Gemmatimonadales bacterium]
MTVSLVDTPLPAPVSLPPLREAAWNPALEAALFRVEGDAASVARLRLPGALLVTTGQQPGLFSGPSYAVSKALSARALAASLERRWNRPVIPLYWIPGDDHDLHEVASVSWLNAEGGLVTAALPPRPPEAPLTPLWREPLGDAVLPLLDAFEQSFAAATGSAATVAWLRRHYRPAATIAGAYGAAMAELLAPFGILCLDSTHAAVKQAAAPLLLRALQQAPALDAALAARAGTLAAAGQDPGVPVGEGASLVFVEGPLGRDRLVLDGKELLARRSKTAFTLAELTRIAEAEPERLSGNVLLRPVLESALLPTVAYVAGPGELRYLALTPPLYQQLGVTGQTPVPRWSGFLLEPRVTRVLAKFGADLEELLAERDSLEVRIARQVYPEGTDRAFAALREAIEQGYEPVIHAARAVDPTLERPAGAARAQALHGLDELGKKLAQHARKRESTELAQIARARLSVRPEGKPQERVLSMAGFLARYGSGLLDDFAAHIDGWYERVLEAAGATL